MFKTLNYSFGITSRYLAQSSNRALRYVSYVEHLHEWSRTLDSCPAERLKWILFEHNGKPVG